MFWKSIKNWYKGTTVVPSIGHYGFWSSTMTVVDHIMVNGLALNWIWFMEKNVNFLVTLDKLIFCLF